MSETILITGITGFLGSHLASCFLQSGYCVVGIKRAESNTSRLAGFKDNPNMYLFDFNDESLSSAFSTHEISTVIHTACSYGRNNESITQLVETNVVLGLRLLEFAIGRGTRLFINCGTLLPPYISGYSLSKHHFSDWLHLFTGHITIVNVCLEHIYGPGDDEKKFIPWILAQLEKKVPEIPLTAGEQLRDFIFIDDVVSAFNSIMLSSGSFSGYTEIELGSGLLVSVKDFVSELFKQYRTIRSDCNAVLNFGALPYREGELMVSHVRMEAIRSLGWNPAFDYKNGIKKTLLEELSK